MFLFFCAASSSLLLVCTMESGQDNASASSYFNASPWEMALDSIPNKIFKK